MDSPRPGLESLGLVTMIRRPTIIVVAIILVLCGLWLARKRFDSDPIRQGRAAFARGNWEAAAERARERLKQSADDTAALQLLARSLARLGRDSSAIAVYNRLTPDALVPDDFWLLGLALSRSGDPRAIKVWEQARHVTPSHPETLFELTRVYARNDKLADATETGRLLSKCPGWEARAQALLGTIELARDNPDAALVHWREALNRPVANPSAESAPIIPVKELARTLLQVRQPDEARHRLEQVLSAAPDPESSWLLSRAYLQMGPKQKALAALEKSGSFRDDHPLTPEPSPFAGSKSCAQCHSAIYHPQQSSRHAHTFFRAAELANISLPPEALLDPGQPEVTHTLKWTKNQQLQQETDVKGQVYSAIVDYAIGSGDRGLTFVGRDHKDAAFELRLSRYRSGTKFQWDVTSGHIRHPDEPTLYLGEPLDADAVRRCLNCHVTSAQEIFRASGPASSDQGIGCEKCHGPGQNHIVAIQSGFPDHAIIDPRMASGLPVVAICAKCHSPRHGNVSPKDPSSARFPGTTLTWSRCFLESQNKLDCVTCHDPHRNVATTASRYEGKCLSCHSAPATVCPVNSTKECIGCHMPLVKNVVPHSSFTDHFIRVHRE
jgi:tetratricopeptide (TPR) repeat protein